jgi:hypothetical protein
MDLGKSSPSRMLVSWGLGHRDGPRFRVGLGPLTA